MMEGLENHDDEAPIKGVQPDAAAVDGQEPADGELRLIVRKLEVPVRPRGVLAE